MFNSLEAAAITVGVCVIAFCYVIGLFRGPRP